MVSTHVDIEQAEWTPGTPFYGPAAVYDGKDIVQLKVLSDRRAEGGGIAWLAKFSPPPGKLIKIVATALSDEHVFNLEGGRATKSGAPARASGGYTLNPDRPAAQRLYRDRNGQPHHLLRRAGRDRVDGSHRCRAPETGIRSRPATQDDLTILWDFLAIAAYEPDVACGESGAVCRLSSRWMAAVRGFRIHCRTRRHGDRCSVGAAIRTR